MNRTLVLLRHAKAEPFASSDHERDLTARGVHEARTAAERLRADGRLPDYVLVSPSRRTLATWRVMQETLGCEPEVVEDASVYQGSEDVLLESLRTVPEHAGTVLLVGHQPSIGYVAHLLDDGEGDPEALRQMLHGYPPGSFAVLEVTGPWADLAPERGRLVGFHSGHA